MIKRFNDSLDHGILEARGGHNHINNVCVVSLRHMYMEGVGVIIWFWPSCCNVGRALTFQHSPLKEVNVYLHSFENARSNYLQ